MSAHFCLHWLTYIDLNCQTMLLRPPHTSWEKSIHTLSWVGNWKCCNTPGGYFRRRVCFSVFLCITEKRIEFTAEHRAGEGSAFLCHRETQNSLCSGENNRAEKRRIVTQSVKRTAPSSISTHGKKGLSHNKVSKNDCLSAMCLNNYFLDCMFDKLLATWWNLMEHDTNFQSHRVWLVTSHTSQEQSLSIRPCTSAHVLLCEVPLGRSTMW